MHHTKNGSVSGMPEKAKSTEKKRNRSGEKKEKVCLSINIELSKEEIEKDIFALTGSKPIRRPKKRPRNIQKQVDAVFPGLWLISITPDSYNVPENFLKQ
ncbi:hypothetical protein CASFOL_005810 [Castilleja foliolosa]|uniref:Uncharacterized protein n=1 Tax=Castilleja foliolosa TaxID=1961234 RepID=A0ABD3E526_9LAMI